jgi:pimeloyl-ACP methyl ester carboxylesterase
MRASLLLLGAVSGAPIPQLGPFKTQSAQFTVGGLIAGGSQDAVIYWPLDAAANAGVVAPAARNVVAFGHGLKAGGAELVKGYGPLLSTLASYGLVAIAPLSCPDSLCLEELAEDLGTVLDTCAANRTLHPALARANFTRVGVAGHSMGASSAGYVASADNATSGYDVHAYVGMHGTPVSKEAGLAVPTMYTTGGKDRIIRPSVVNSSFVKSVGAHPRVLAVLADATHFEPTDPLPGHERLNPYVAAFLLCHVAGDGQSCAKVYDAGDVGSLCNAFPDKMSQPDGACQIVE